jgi:hypothetical protein
VEVDILFLVPKPEVTLAIGSICSPYYEIHPHELLRSRY